MIEYSKLKKWLNMFRCVVLGKHFYLSYVNISHENGVPIHSPFFDVCKICGQSKPSIEPPFHPMHTGVMIHPYGSKPPMGKYQGFVQSSPKYPPIVGKKSKQCMACGKVLPEFDANCLGCSELRRLNR